VLRLTPPVSCDAARRAQTALLVDRRNPVRKGFPAVPGHPALQPHSLSPPNRPGRGRSPQGTLPAQRARRMHHYSLGVIHPVPPSVTPPEEQLCRLPAEFIREREPGQGAEDGKTCNQSPPKAERKFDVGTGWATRPYNPGTREVDPNPRAAWCPCRAVEPPNGEPVLESCRCGTAWLGGVCSAARIPIDNGAANDPARRAFQHNSTGPIPVPVWAQVCDSATDELSSNEGRLPVAQPQSPTPSLCA
jgi:hypothetical protein